MVPPVHVKVTRRIVLGGLLAAAAAGVNFLYPGAVVAARGLTPVPRATNNKAHIGGGPDITYMEGRVVAKSAAGFVLQSDAQTRTVRADPTAVVWKEFDVTVADIAIGDWVDVKGEPLPDGSLAARSGWIWVNIGRWDGTISATAKDGLVVSNAQGQTRGIRFSSRLEVIHARDQSRISGGTDALTSGTAIGAVGLRLPNGDLRATRIWVNNS